MLILLCVIGLLVGGQINRAIYEWAWSPRQISPWSKPPGGVVPRTWSDCIPVVGWWVMRRESQLHGRLFWLRPIFIELLCGIGLPALYWWEVTGGKTSPATWFAHAVLFGLMLIATFIDIDEKTIPDYVTIPGTLVALLMAAALGGQSLLPHIPPPANEPVLLTTPRDTWPLPLDTAVGLGISLFCWIGWCYGLLPKTIYFRRGIIKGLRFQVVSILRHPWSRPIAGMGIVGVGVITAVWWLGGSYWQGLLSSLVGLAFGGGLVWAIRIVSGYVLGMEAMGFGDVTLMAMIGAFLGWQAALMTFFLAPFTAVVLALSQWILTGKRDIPFGPFLCAAAAIVIVEWSSMWTRWSGIFELGLLIPTILLIGILLMGVMLAILQVIKRLLGLI